MGTILFYLLFCVCSIESVKQCQKEGKVCVLDIDMQVSMAQR